MTHLSVLMVLAPRSYLMYIIVMYIIELCLIVIGVALRCKGQGPIIDHSSIYVAHHPVDASWDVSPNAEGG